MLEVHSAMSLNRIVQGRRYSPIEILAGVVDGDAADIVIPLYASHISAGFPSPADDYIEAELDLNRLMVRNPPDTFMVRVKGAALSGAGILVLRPR